MSRNPRPSCSGGMARRRTRVRLVIVERKWRLEKIESAGRDVLEACLAGNIFDMEAGKNIARQYVPCSSNVMLSAR